MNISNRLDELARKLALRVQGVKVSRLGQPDMFIMSLIRGGSRGPPPCPQIPPRYVDYCLQQAFEIYIYTHGLHL